MYEAQRHAALYETAQPAYAAIDAATQREPRLLRAVYLLRDAA